MINYGRSATHESSVVEQAPSVTTTTDEPVATVRTTDRTYTPAGPEGLSVVGRFVAFIFGVLQALLILRIVLLSWSPTQATTSWRSS